MRDFRNIIRDFRNIEAKDKIIIKNIKINNPQNFENQMNDKGYSNLMNNFLVKQFNNIEINITIMNNEVTAITGYDNEHNMIDIPNDINNIVEKDINESNEIGNI